MRTVIHGGDVIAYHGGGHRLLRGGSLAYDNDRVVFVGGAYTGPSDHQIDATGKLVIPGLVNLHCHATTEAAPLGHRPRMALATPDDRAALAHLVSTPPHGPSMREEQACADSAGGRS